MRKGLDFDMALRFAVYKWHWARTHGVRADQTKADARLALLAKKIELKRKGKG